MPRITRPPEFNSSMPVYIRRPFVVNGRRFTSDHVGEEFDWKRRSIAHRIVRNLYSSGYITHDMLQTRRHLAASPMRPAPAVSTGAATTQAPGTTPAPPMDGPSVAAPVAPETVHVDTGDLDTPENAEIKRVLESLDSIDRMVELRELSKTYNVPTKSSKDEQREALRSALVGMVGA